MKTHMPKTFFGCPTWFINQKMKPKSHICLYVISIKWMKITKLKNLQALIEKKRQSCVK